MPKLSKTLLPLLATVAVTQTVEAQVFVNEAFDYPDLPSLQANWGSSASLSLNTADGVPSPSASHTGAGGAANLIRWTGALSLTPTDEAPVRLSADIFNSGTAGQANTVGFRQMGGISPLFEMGSYRSFDNDINGAALNPTQAGIGVRTINIGNDLNLQDWAKMGELYTGWATWQATFGSKGVDVQIDLERDGDWDLSYTEIGTGANTGTFGDLRIHSPVASTGGGFSVDNIRVEVIPEPSTIALGALGAAALFLRRRKS